MQGRNNSLASLLQRICAPLVDMRTLARTVLESRVSGQGTGSTPCLRPAASRTTPPCRLFEMAPTDFPRYPTRETGGDNASVKGYVYALLWYLDSLTPQ